MRRVVVTGVGAVAPNGIGIENFNDIQVGDQIESYLMEKVAGTLA